MVIAVAIALLTPLPIALFSPRLAASAFGVPAYSPEANAYLLATGTRDFALGIWLLFIVKLDASRRLLAVSVWSISIVAVGDAINVAVYTKSQNALTLLPHVAGAAILFFVGWWLWNHIPLVRESRDSNTA